MALSKQAKKKRKAAGFEPEAPTCLSCVRKERRPMGLLNPQGRQIEANVCTVLGISLLFTPRGLCNNWQDKHGNTLE